MGTLIAKQIASAVDLPAESTFSSAIRKIGWRGISLVDVSPVRWLDAYVFKCLIRTCAAFASKYSFRSIQCAGSCARVRLNQSGTFGLMSG